MAARVWNPGWQPTKTPLDRYSCRHGLGYTILEGEKDGICAAQELFVPKGDACELDRLTLTNRSDRPRELDVFSYVEFCLWDAVDDSTNFQRNFSTGEVEVEPCAIYHKTEYRERRDHYAVFWSNTPVTSFDTARDAFCGVYGGPADPQAVRAGHCSGSIAHGWAPVGALHIHVTLAPGEEKKILFGLGYIENPQEEKFTAPGVINKTRAHAMMARYADDAQVDAARAALADYWESLLSGYRLARIHIGCRCGRILSALFVIVALTIKEQYDIGILLDRTRISQVGNLRSVVITLFCSTGKL